MDTVIKPSVLINGKLYFDLAGAAKSLHRSVHTIRRDIGRKRIKVLDYGRAKYFLPEWLDEYILRLTEEAKKNPKKFMVVNHD